MSVIVKCERYYNSFIASFMAFILSANRKDPKESAEAFREYQLYLASVERQFPPSAFKLATSDWYFGGGPKSPHDGWLESIQLHYARVFNYSLSASFHTEPGAEISHGDWLWDEFTLSDKGNVVHEIEWQHGVWKIEADDVLYRWTEVA